jgi:succinyl-diaminopimelate desuccinylase
MPSSPALSLLHTLIACPSVTPDHAGCFDVIEAVLVPLGFRVWRQTFQAEGTAAVENWYARYGEATPNLCFAGHVDVVPVGNRSQWQTEPFIPTEKEGMLYGRGASDMKGAIAAFVTAAAAFVQTSPAPEGSISLLLTADEEGPSVNGTKPMLAWLKEQGQTLTYCLVGEPTNPQTLGEMVKIGRRGSLNGVLTVHGVQGHVAYPEQADNPNHLLVNALARLLVLPLDNGNEHFPASSLQITSIDVGNGVTNIIPSAATARFNIRYNNEHTAVSLEALLKETLSDALPRYTLSLTASGDAFLTPPGPLSQALSAAVEEVTGKMPMLSTSGGTSDARFIKDYCPVIEFGGVNATIHQVNEACRVTDIDQLVRLLKFDIDSSYESTFCIARLPRWWRWNA